MKLFDPFFPPKRKNISFVALTIGEEQYGRSRMHGRSPGSSEGDGRDTTDRSIDCAAGAVRSNHHWQELGCNRDEFSKGVGKGAGGTDGTGKG